MRFECDLCHIDSDRVIIRIKAFEGELSLGSTLGEGSTAEIAEDRAIVRLNNRLNKNNEQKLNTNINQIVTKPQIGSIAINANSENIEINSNKILTNKKKDENANYNESKKTIPKDWSKDLASIDYEIKRLKWDKDKENAFIKKNIGCANRTRIKNYNDLRLLLEKLTKLTNIESTEEAVQNNTKENLFTISNSLIEKLEWSNFQGRDFLKNHFKVSSRKELNFEQLEKFNELLENELTK